MKRPWKIPADQIFNSIFPVEEMEREDCEGYVAALFEQLTTPAKFRKMCKIMAKERADALKEE
jgi:hypothetical protein